MPPHSTFPEEMMAAGRGIVGLLVGNREAGSYFDLSQRGLVGSFIALLLVTALSAAMPLVMGIEGASIALSLFTAALLYGLQLAFAAIALRQFRRLDGFVPYLIADNWATFFVTLLATAIVAAGFASGFGLIVLAIITMIIKVNIARLIVTLAPLQIAAFIIAQLVGAAIGMLMLPFIIPLDPALLTPAA